MTEMEDRVLALEVQVANRLMDAAKLLLEMQSHTQPGSVLALQTAMHDACEIRFEITIGAYPYIRILTVDADGEDSVLLRRLELKQPTAH